MNDDDATALLDRLTADLPHPSTPVGLLAEGRRRLRRRRRVQLGAGLAAVVVAVAGVAIVPTLVGSGDGPTPIDRPDAVPPPPDGMRWVGHGSVVLAVPRAWGTGDTGCNDPLSDTVYRYNELLEYAFCVSPQVSGASSLELVISDPTDIGSLSAGPVSCEQPRIPTCRGTLSVPDQGVDFAVTTHGSDAAEVAQAILDSVMFLPAGWTTVPWQDGPFTSTHARQQLEAAGLTTDVDGRIGARAPVSTLPEPGSLVRVGSVVQLIEPPAPSPMVVGQAVALPGQVVGLLFPNGAGRGIGFSIEAEDGTTYYLTSVRQPGVEPLWSADPPVWPDVGVGGPGPDRVVVPDVATPGRYRICTANAAEELCTSITVTE